MQVDSSMSDRDSVMFSRYTDGARPVRVVDDGWQVAKDGHPMTYTTAQALLAELTGHPKGRHWSLDRYFSLGRHAPKQLLGHGDILDLFPIIDDKTKSGIVLLEPLAPDLVAFRSNTPDTAISIPRKTRLRGKNRDKNVSRAQQQGAELIISGPVGIDLAKRSLEIRKLMFAGFGRRIFAGNYDPDDVLQEIYKGLLARNRGKCPWDPNKSSFGHYVYMVCGCVLSNYHRKQRRVRQFEQIGLPSYQDGEYKSRDAASNTTKPGLPTLAHEETLYGEVVDDLVDFMLTLPWRYRHEARLAVDVLPYVTSGTPRKSISAELGISMVAVGRAVSFLRKSSIAWKQSMTH